MWHKELDAIKQQIDSCKKDHEQRVREIQAEVTEVERKAKEQISELARVKEKRISELEAQSMPLVARYQAQLEPIQRQIKLTWEQKCNLQESIRGHCPHV